MSPLDLGNVYGNEEKVFSIISLKNGELQLGDFESKSGKTENDRPENLDSTIFTIFSFDEGDEFSTDESAEAPNP